MPLRHIPFVLLLTILSVLFSCRSETPPAAHVARASLSPVLEVPAEPPGPDTLLAETRMGPGDALATALERLGPDNETRVQWQSTLSDEIDPRRIPIGSGLRAWVDSAGRPSRLELRASEDGWWSLRRENDRWRAQWNAIAVDESVHSIGAVIDESVAAALADHPLGTALTAGFADVLQWDVDLFVDPRKGDRIAIVYTMKQPVAGERPSFGGGQDSPRLGRILALEYAGARASAQAFFVETGNESEGFYDLEGRPLKKAFLKSPLNYTRISSRFSKARRHPITRRVIPHHGIDFVAPRGTPVSATADGTVTTAGWQGALGRAVTLRHPNGYKTYYGHLNGIAKGIVQGTSVRQNQIIGFVGSTGRATGAHLHYTMKHNGRAIDPFKLKTPPIRPLPEEELPRLVETAGRYIPDLLSSLPPDS